VQDARASVAAFTGQWIAGSLEASSRKWTTKECYATIARAHLVPAPFGRTPLNRLRPSDVEALLMLKRRSGLSASTVRTIHTVLRSVLEVAVRDQLMRRNPAAAVRRPGAERREAAYLTGAQVTTLLSPERGSDST